MTTIPPSADKRVSRVRPFLNFFSRIETAVSVEQTLVFRNEYM